MLDRMTAVVGGHNLADTLRQIAHEAYHFLSHGAADEFQRASLLQRIEVFREHLHLPESSDLVKWLDLLEAKLVAGAPWNARREADLEPLGFPRAVPAQTS